MAPAQPGGRSLCDAHPSVPSPQGCSCQRSEEDAPSPPGPRASVRRECPNRGTRQTRRAVLGWPPAQPGGRSLCDAHPPAPSPQGCSCQRSEEDAPEPAWASRLSSPRLPEPWTRQTRRAVLGWRWHSQVGEACATHTRLPRLLRDAVASARRRTHPSSPAVSPRTSRRARAVLRALSFVNPRRATAEKVSLHSPRVSKESWAFGAISVGGDAVSSAYAA